MSLQFKSILMSTAEKRATLCQKMNELDDKFIEAIYAIVEAYVEKEEEQEDQIIGYRAGTFEPVYASKMVDELDSIMKEVEEGDYITLEDLEKESETW